MYESSDISVLAIDGGGSRCRLACEMAGRVLRVETGSANAHSDFDGALLQIRKGLSKLARQLSIEEEKLSHVPAFIGLAGVISESIRARLRAALPFDRVVIEDDRPAALRGAVGANDGAIFHSGTGSFLALQRAGQIRLAGGWGSILGDEASAKWIGWSALNAALRVADGTLPENALANALIDDMGGAEAVVQFAVNATPADFGAIAPRITEAAAEGNPFAQAILHQGAQHITEAIRALGWSEGMDLCLTGSVAPFYKDYLPDSVAQALRAPIGEPLDGALSLAREVAHDIR